MDPILRLFIDERTTACSAARVSLRQLHAAFLEVLRSDRERSLWPRWRFLQQIEPHYVTGLDEHNVMHIAGLALNREWVKDENGRLRLVAAS